MFPPVLRVLIRDPGFGSGIRIRDELPGSYFLELRNQFFGLKYKFFDEDPGSGMGKIRIQDGKKSGPGYEINVPDPQHWFSHSQSPLSRERIGEGCVTGRI
jgi:hypothetical protein